MKLQCIYFHRWAIVLALLSAVMMPGPGIAEVYVYTTPDGVRHVTNQPVAEPRYALARTYNADSAVDNLYIAWNLVADRTQLYDAHIRTASEKYGVDAALIKAVIRAESNFDPVVVSNKGAYGLMQLIAGTAERYGVRDVFNPAQNIDGGVRYLADLMKMFPDNPAFVLAAYNAGENNVLRYNGIPPFTETQAYVKKVMQFQSHYQGAL